MRSFCFAPWRFAQCRAVPGGGAKYETQFWAQDSDRHALADACGGLRESQVESDLSILKNHVLPELGHLVLAEISVRDIDRYKAKKRQERHQYGKGYSAKSLNNHLSVLHRIFEKAIEYEYVTKNPVTRRAWARRDRTAEDSANWWPPQEERAAIAQLDQWRDTRPLERLAILTQLMIGVRFSELRAFEKTDLDLTAPGLWVRRSMARKTVGTTKNKRARFQVIPRALADELREWVQQGDDKLLFPDPRGGYLSNKVLNRWYRELAAEAGVKVITSHGARHSAGSSYAVMGVGQKMIAKLLGHADTGATERYTHVQVDATKPLVEERWNVLMKTARSRI